MLFTLFYDMQGKKIKTRFVYPAGGEYFGIKPTNFLSTNWLKNYPLVKWTAKYVFRRCNYKNSCFSEFGVKLQCPYANDLYLQRCSQRSCFGFCVFCFEGLLLFCIAYLLRFETIELLFANEILVFKTER